ncbi:hypothetical protein TRV_00756 [Trichophyton verrucosum HKI 0517]|uniref:Mandelate racemase/muconate lactonizing enzyme C-terminal domain-containing protein n=1 Tax=Trichophyton verrucosum (strain HKI 0517) TaxID=663202 RepID=D4D110_TRIVH|nr:uncharacterized protein TRV_00756 [Trichophyton verrucosum HKI 0517]EFE44487.1 hypothetical protein TRV_00756 [Trichophyton verrucosum HKI 0517]
MATIFPTIKTVNTFIIDGVGSGGDYHNVCCYLFSSEVYCLYINILFQVKGGHWLIDSPIATPMARWEQYRSSRTSWGINVLGSFCVEIEATDGTKGFATGFGGPPACWLVAQHFERFLIGADLAIWDLLGKIRNEPVYKLIGGTTRSRLDFYCTGPEPGYSKAMGFSGAKVALPYGPDEGASGLARNVEYLQQQREKVGPNFPLRVDCYMSLNVPYTIELVKACEAAGINIDWWEECLSPDDVDGQALLKRAHPTIKFTTGEHEYSRYGFRKLIESRNLDIVQPDVMWVGGMTELLKISAMAAAYDIPVVPHASGPYSYHFVVSQPNSPFQEYLANSPDGKTVQPVFGDLFLNEPIPSKGYLDVSALDEPGFGLKLNPAAKLIPARYILTPGPQVSLRDNSIASRKDGKHGSENSVPITNGTVP